MKPTLLAIGSALLLTTTVASAHVIVRPNSAGIASVQIFTLGVPNEKDTPVTALRLTLPDGLQEVVPSVKAGWQVSVKKSGSGDSATATEIDWTGGSIPVEQRDDFTFSATVPASTTTLIWKAYQTYQDGSVVAWDQDPQSIPSGQEGNPYSTTSVVNDLTPTPTTTTTTDTAARALGGIALILAAVGFVQRFRR